MNGLDINKFMSKKLAIAFFTIWTIGNGGADPNVTVISQAAIAIAAMIIIWLIEKGNENELLPNTTTTESDSQNP